MEQEYDWRSAEEYYQEGAYFHEGIVNGNADPVAIANGAVPFAKEWPF